MDTVCVKPRLALLRRRHLAGQPVDLGDLFEAARLTPNMRHVVRQRLEGHSYRDIAGANRSKQTVHSAERHACRKLGLAGSIDSTVYAAERSDRGRDLADRSKGTTPDDLHGDGPTYRKGRRPTGREAIQRQLDRLADRWLTVTETDVAGLRAEAARLSVELARLG